jgi:hypothetical protein
MRRKGWLELDVNLRCQWSKVVVVRQREREHDVVDIVACILHLEVVVG